VLSVCLKMSPGKEDLDAQALAPRDGLSRPQRAYASLPPEQVGNKGGGSRRMRIEPSRLVLGQLRDFWDARIAHRLSKRL